ncbi:hypothetical protein HYR69_10760 [Candidatus Sumerlaeota bacterium]|nr:hypothetical protein [Candidatus Sumerlaeota bacterium]
MFLLVWTDLVYAVANILPHRWRGSRVGNLFRNIIVSFVLQVMTGILWFALRIIDGDFALTRSVLSASLQISMPISSLLAGIWLRPHWSLQFQRALNSDGDWNERTPWYLQMQSALCVPAALLALKRVTGYPYFGCTGDSEIWILWALVQILLTSSFISVFEEARIGREQIESTAIRPIIVRLTAIFALAWSLIYFYIPRFELY